MRKTQRLSLSLTALGLWLLLAPPDASAYSVLTHEAIIDSTWDTGIRPLLVKRFPVACTVTALVFWPT